VQFRAVLRGDLGVNDFIKFEDNQVMLETQQSRADIRNKANFASTYRIVKARHLGNNRQTGGDNWVSVFDCIPANGVS